MMVSAQQLLPWIVLLPFLGAIFNGLFGKRLPKRAVYGVAIGSVAIAFVLACRAVWALREIAIENPIAPALKHVSWTWLNVGIFQFDIAFYLDPLSAVLLLIVTGVGLLIHIYSVGYMSEDPSVSRYFAYLNLFMFSMLTLILGKNLLMLFVGWEGVGLCSYLLIGFWFTDDQKAQAGQKAFIVNRIGDVGFVIGLIMLLFYSGGTTDYEALAWNFEYLGQRQYGPFPDYGTLTLCCLLLFVGATGKSAQIPLYVWLPDAMAGPTPVSALIHAATMVTAGVYMMARLAFMFTLSPMAMGVIATIGALTAISAAMMALTQRDIKKVLAYSTVSQLGYMVLAIGVGAFAAGVFHLMTHAFFKALLFLGAGSVIHGLMGQQDLFKMGGLRRKMPWTHATMLIATLAIAGVPFLSGYYSKDAILWETLTLQQNLQIPESAVASYSDGNEIFVAGAGGVVMHGVDGNWQDSRVPTAKAGVGQSRQDVHPRLRALSRDASGTVWAVGDYASIFNNAGGRWQLAHQVENRPDAALRGLWVGSPDNVWFVGDNGLIIHYDGTDYSPVPSGTVVGLRAITGRGAGEIYIGGAEGTLLKYDGTSVAAIESPTASRISDLKLVGGTIWGTTDTGDLLALTGSNFTKAKLDAPGVARVRRLGVIASGTERLTLTGQIEYGGSTTFHAAVLVQQPDGTFSAHQGKEGSTLSTVYGEGSTIFAATSQRELLRVEGDSLVVQGGVPHKPWFHKILWILGVLAAGLTAFYMFRLYFLCFHGETRLDKDAWAHAHESPAVMTVPLVILAVLSIGAGWFGDSLFAWLDHTLRVANARLISHPHGLLAYAPTVIGGLGIALAYFWYASKSKMPSQLAERFPRVYQTLYNKFYVDEFYDLVVIKPYRALASFLHKVVDVMLIDTLVVRGVAMTTAGVGWVVRAAQSGNVQHYAVAIAIGLAALFFWVGV
ncbi:MAG: NADH:ubiquinone oxidoreductase subunit 5 (subunit L)/multisubunit Na+/H+ antiporter MnhA subunit [Myxococcota bacterium]|jgi:NADH:ubiquinone oxidoreductase subunit 5 (subunit L)/multisubunit Na+/H+ antiporter MnhA subunit